MKRLKIDTSNLQTPEDLVNFAKNQNEAFLKERAAAPQLVGNLFLEADKEGNPIGHAYGKTQPVDRRDPDPQMHPESHAEQWASYPEVITKGRHFMQVPRARICFYPNTNSFSIMLNKKYRENPLFVKEIRRHLNITDPEINVSLPEGPIVDSHYPDCSSEV